jgi:acyl-CoA thioesterase I
MNASNRAIATLLSVIALIGFGSYLNSWQLHAASPPLAAAQPKLRIMPLGDSITQSNKDHGSYRRVLWQTLKQGGYNVDFVGSLKTHYQGPAPTSDFDLDHEGHWGWRIDEILTQLDGWTKTARPDIVLVHLGTNDIAQQQDIKSTVDELAQVVQVLRKNNPKVKVLLGQIIPLWGKEKLCQEFNGMVKQLAQKTSTRQSLVIAVDLFTGFRPEPNADTFDGAHPNESGEKKMAERWFTALKTVLR